MWRRNGTLIFLKFMIFSFKIKWVCAFTKKYRHFHFTTNELTLKVLFWNNGNRLTEVHVETAIKTQQVGIIQHQSFYGHYRYTNQPDSQQPRLRTAEFCCSSRMPLLMVATAFGLGKDVRLFLSGVIHTISVPHQWVGGYNYGRPA